MLEPSGGRPHFRGMDVSRMSFKRGAKNGKFNRI